jgi:hypothetical protein
MTIGQTSIGQLTTDQMAAVHGYVSPNRVGKTQTSIGLTVEAYRHTIRFCLMLESFWPLVIWRTDVRPIVLKLPFIGTIFEARPSKNLIKTRSAKTFLL